MIGQTKVLTEISKISDGQFPRFSIICGLRGSGKTSLIKYINDTKIHAEYNEISSIDDIRQICIDAPMYTEPRLYVLSDFDSMNFRAKESILKLCEDIPPNLYIMIETISVENIKQTLLSRANVIKLSGYTDTELTAFCHTLEGVDENEISYLISSFKTPGDIARAHSCGIRSLVEFCQKVLSNIYNANTFNAMKIADSLKLKADGQGYELDLFFTVLMNCAAISLPVDKAHQLILSTSHTLQKLNMKSINKLMLFDAWLFEVKGVSI